MSGGKKRSTLTSSGEIDLRGFGSLASAFAGAALFFVALGVYVGNAWSTLWGLFAGLCLLAAAIAIGQGLRDDNY